MALRAHMVTIDCVDPPKLAEFWTQAAGYQVTWDGAGGEFLVLGAAQGDGVALGLQRVPEPRLGKNRVHVDWAADDREAEVKRLTALGATVAAEHSMPNLTWTVLADPEGNEFCVSGRG
jgi:predicted enzyme related to lactoylglutathione lyase